MMTRQRLSLGLLCISTLALAIFSSSQFAVYAQTYQQVLPTDKRTLKIGISTDPASPNPGSQAKLKIDFLNPQSGAIQQHIDYIVTMTKDGKAVFGPLPLTHTSTGTVSIPVGFKDNGDHQVIVDVQGILFQPIPSEKATFTVKVGQDSTKLTKDDKISDKATDKSKSDTKPKKDSQADKNKNSKAQEDKKSKSKNDTKAKEKAKKSIITKQTKPKPQ